MRRVPHRVAYERGRNAEQRVVDLLLGAGRFVLARNWRGGGGELDIVALHEGKLRFIEVRAWSEADRDGLSSLSTVKQRRLHRAAEAFLATYKGPYEEACFCLAVVTDTQVRWHDDPFSVG